MAEFTAVVGFLTLIITTLTLKLNFKSQANPIKLEFSKKQYEALGIVLPQIILIRDNILKLVTVSTLLTRGTLLAVNFEEKNITSKAAQDTVRQLESQMFKCGIYFQSEAIKTVHAFRLEAIVIIVLCNSINTLEDSKVDSIKALNDDILKHFVEFRESLELIDQTLRRMIGSDPITYDLENIHSLSAFSLFGIPQGAIDKSKDTVIQIQDFLRMMRSNLQGGKVKRIKS